MVPFYINLTLSVVIWATLNLWVLSKSEFDLVLFGFAATTYAMLGVFFWVIYTITLSLTILPKLDELVYPDRVDFFRIADNQLFKMFRLNEYAAAIHSKRARRLHPLKIDLRTLPGQLRMPITAYLYWMILNFGAMVTGVLTFSYTG